MKNQFTMTGSERILRLNYQLSKVGLDPLDTEQRALFLLDPERMPDDARKHLAGELAGLFDDLRDRVGINCDDLWPVFKGSSFLAHDIAANFASQLRAFLTPAQLDDIADKNEAEENPNVCHTHDHCDANEVMQTAFRSVCGRDSELPSSEREQQAAEDCKLWNEAFRLVRFYCSRIGHALARAGFKCEHQGGGMWNWRIDLKNGLELYVCDEDGCEPTDSEPVRVGLQLSGSEVITENVFAFGAGLAQVINAREGSK